MTTTLTTMKRVIVDYQKLNEEILSLLVDKFPDGYDREDIISFRNAQNEIVECVEVRTQDSIYLVKISKRLVSAMEDFEQDDDYQDENYDADDTADQEDPIDELEESDY